MRPWRAPRFPRARCGSCVITRGGAERRGGAQDGADVARVGHLVEHQQRPGPLQHRARATAAPADRQAGPRPGARCRGRATGRAAPARHVPAPAPRVSAAGRPIAASASSVSTQAAQAAGGVGERRRDRVQRRRARRCRAAHPACRAGAVPGAGRDDVRASAGSRARLQAAGHDWIAAARRPARRADEARAVSCALRIAAAPRGDKRRPRPRR